MATDDFNRADGPGLGANWTVFVGSFRTRLSSYACGGIGSTSGNIAIWNADTLDPNQYVQATIVSLSASGPFMGLVARALTSEETHYRFLTDDASGAWEFIRVNNGTNTVINSGTGLSAGHIARMEVEGVGATVTIRLYGGATGTTLLSTESDSDAGRLVTGQSGIWIYNEYDDNSLDDWSGGNLEAEPEPPSALISASNLVGNYRGRPKVFSHGRIR